MPVLFLKIIRYVSAIRHNSAGLEADDGLKRHLLIPAEA
jgi:hypothetical protein